MGNEENLSQSTEGYKGALPGSYPYGGLGALRSDFRWRIDFVMPELSPEQCRAARGLLNWTQLQLAKAAGIGQVTVRNFELGRGGEQRPATLEALRQALEAAGVEFIDGKRPGVRLKG